MSTLAVMRVVIGLAPGTLVPYSTPHDLREGGCERCRREIALLGGRESPSGGPKDASQGDAENGKGTSENGLKVKLGSKRRRPMLGLALQVHDRGA
jgi:hypothetical protein